MKKAAKLRTPTQTMPVAARSGSTSTAAIMAKIVKSVLSEMTVLESVDQAATIVGVTCAGPAATIRGATTMTCAVILTLNLPVIYQLVSAVPVTTAGGDL